MNNPTVHETELFKLTFLVAGIVVAMFLSTVLVALVFMPNQLIASMPFEDIRFLFPMALATICSMTVLGLYARTHKSRSKNS